MATLVSGLGGPAGYGENVFSTTTKTAGNNDDGSVAVDVTSVFESGITFFGTTYTSIYINSNGAITFASADTGYNQNGFDDFGGPALLPFYSDINIASGGEIYWDLDPASNQITITWDSVAPFSGSGVNSFQVVLTDLGNGEVDVTYIYGDIQWADSGGPAATTGLTDGADISYALEFSDNAAGLLSYETNDFDGGDPAGTFSFATSGGFPDLLIVQGSGGNDAIGLGFIDALGNSVTSGNEMIDAGAGNDTIDGGQGADTIYGGAGDDTLTSSSEAGSAITWTDVGSGANLQGTSGQDFFRYNGGSGSNATIRLNNSAPADAADSVADYIHVTSTANNVNLMVGDFQTGVDKIVLSDNFSVVSSSISGSEVNITVELSGGGRQNFIIYVDGPIDTSQIFTTTLPTTTTVVDDDVLYGGDGADTFQLEDQSGDDTIFGGEGGTDTDTFDATALGSGVTVEFTGDEAGTLSTGSDSVTFSQIEGFDLTASDDMLDAIGTTSAVSASGGAGADILTGGFGNDTLLGGLDNDNLQGGQGADSLDGGGGADSIIGDGQWLNPADYASGNVGSATNLTVTNSADAAIEMWWVRQDGTLEFYQTIQPGQTFVQATFDDHNWVLRDADGFYLDVILGAPNQSLDYGAVGLDDSIAGGDGADTLRGQYGDDSLDGGWGNDTLFGGSGGDTLDAFDGDDTLYGGAGDDTLLGNFGTDSFDGGDGTDWLKIDGSSVVNVAFDIDLAAGSDQYGNTYSGIENITGGNLADTLAGDSQDNILEGGAGDDIISGVAGNNTLSGGLNNDSIYGGSGNDTIYGGDGDDFLKTGQGNDALFGGAGADTLMNSAGDDTLTGGTGDDLLIATAGNDTLFGGAGNDTLMGGTDNDSIEGGADNDLILGDLAGVEFNATGIDGVGVATNITDFPTTQLTYELTFASTDASGLTALASYATSVEDNEFTLQLAGGNLAIYIGGAFTDTGIPAATIFDGNINTLAVSWDSGTGAVEVYLNGANLYSGTAATGTVLDTGGTFVLAQDQDTLGGGFDTNQAFEGTIYGVRLYDDIRSPTEVLDSVAGPYADTSDPNLVANWVADAETAAFTDTTGSHSMVTSGDVSLTYSSGADTLDGGAGADTIYGGGGDDQITFGEGDSVAGGDGDDTFTLADYGEIGANNIALDGGGGAEDELGDTLRLGSLADLSTLNITSTYTNASGNTSQDGSVTLDDGSTLTFSNIETVVCFTSGTLIRTPNGDRPIETLQPGDLVVTRDNGPQPLAWIGQRRLNAADLGRNANHLPVLIRPDLIGADTPLLVSQQHGVLIKQDGIEMLFRAKHLAQTNGGQARIANGCKAVTYIHLLFETHQIVFANGAPSESLYPGPQAVHAMAAPAQQELARLFPDLIGSQPIQQSYGPTARAFQRRHALPDHLRALSPA